MILVFLENVGSNLPKSAKVAISAALSAKQVQGYKRAVGVLLGSDGVGEAAKAASSFGLDEVVYVNSPILERYLALNFENALKEVFREYDPSLFISASTSIGKDLTPRIAAGLEAGQASDVLAFLPGDVFRRLMFAGNIISEIQILSSKKIATIRLTAFEPAKPVADACVCRELTIALSADSRQEFVAYDTVKGERPELADAEIVVSGGRALKSEENFKQLLTPLADLLGAALGASRAAVDSGFAPNDWQVGQTGKVVAPQLYIAVGISGAIQHLAGMKDSKVIVAINKDAEAPIFEVADYGLVADLFQAVPELTEQLKLKRTET